ncbi:MAG: hypothetical protein MPJ50_14935 [Pirellulales bacterium]|nr:hypothetical protein [Pirellulales bacterium]
MRAQKTTASVTVWASLAAGVLCLPACGESADTSSQSTEPALTEYARNTPQGLTNRNVPTRIEPAQHFHTAAEESAVDSHVQPADFSWRQSGPILPASPAQRLDPAEAWSEPAPNFLPQTARGAESLYPQKTPTSQPSGLPLAKTTVPDNQRFSVPPWGHDVSSADQVGEPPPPEAYSLSEQGPPAANRSGQLGGSSVLTEPLAGPVIPQAGSISQISPTELPWRNAPWEAGRSTTQPPSRAAAPVLPPAVSRRAEELTRQALDLAGRGATYSAREELIRVLEVVAESLDAAEQSTRHRRALGAAFRALDEAIDFSPRGSTLLTEIDIKTVSSGHMTPVLDDPGIDLQQISAVECSRAYYTFAQQQLTFACDGQQPASLALYGLGKLNSVLAESGNSRVENTATRAIVFHQAALAVDSGNWRAANELAVQFARSSRYEEARDWLQHATRLSDSQELWANLAVVHRYLGQNKLARQASAQSERLANRINAQPVGPVNVQWVAPQAFSGARPNQ